MAAADQSPIGSGFPAKSEPAEVLAGIDLTGRTAIVTGGYSGIGLETTRALASVGADVIVPVRTPEKAAETLAGVADDLPGSITTHEMDLADLGTVDAFTAAMNEQLDELDLLINNAGVMATPERRVGPGWEYQFGINHLGHFALAQGLMPLLEAADAARVVVLSSTGHHRSDIRWDDIHFESTPYEKWEAYGQAKTANSLFAVGLSERLKASGGRAFSVHPGGIFTPLQRDLPIDEQIMMGWLDEDGQPSALAQQFFKTPSQGCTTTLWAATSPMLDDAHGLYCEDCDVSQLRTADSPRGFGVEGYAVDPDSAERLWELTEAMVSR